MQQKTFRWLSVILLFAFAGKAADDYIPALFINIIANQPLDYMFSQTGEGVTVYGQTFTTYEAGFGGLLGHVNHAMKQSLDETNPPAYSDLRIPSDYAGLPAFSDGKTSFNYNLSDDFLHYSPAYVKWAFANLIPNSEDELDGVTYQELYTVVGARFFRILAESYVLISYLGEDVEQYKREMEAGDFDAWGFMRKRQYLFRGIDTRYAPKGATSPFTAGMAYTWWIRRHLDGSQSALWEGISEVLQAYDPEFYQKLWEEK